MHLQLNMKLDYQDDTSKAQALLAAKDQRVNIVDSCAALNSLQCSTSTECKYDGVRGVCASQIDGNTSHYMSTRAVYHALYKSMPRPNIQDERPKSRSTQRGDMVLLKKSKKKKSSKKNKSTRKNR